MSQYTLNFNFTTDQLQTLYMTGTNVVIARSLNGQMPIVAWQVVRPMQANTLGWENAYGIYASTTNIQNGAVINQMSESPSGAVMGKMYTLEQQGFISGPGANSTPGAYSLTNKFSNLQYLTTGLFQGATVNGMYIPNNVCTAQPTLLMSTAVMSPDTAIYIWLQSMVMSNSVVTYVTSPMTKLNFGGSVNQMSVQYDSASGRFIPAQAAGKKKAADSAAALEHIAPVL